MTSPAEPDTLHFACPRCHVDGQERFYGPCGDCRQDLRRSVGTGARVVDVAAYEPAMHVTPNAVALKE